MLRAVLLVVLVGCSQPSPARPPAPGPARPAPPAARPTPRPERFTLRAGASTELDGREVRFTGVLEPDGHVVSGRAWLEQAGGTVGVPLEGCARSADHAYRVERAVAGRGSWARFARMRADADLTPTYGERSAFGILQIARTTDGWTVAIGTIDVRADGSVIVVIDARRGDASEQASVYLPLGEGSGTQPLGREHLVTLRPSGEHDALGCPTFEAVLEHPESQIVDVEAGEAVWLRRRARARAGALTVRFEGIGERIVRNGPHQAIVSVELAEGSRAESRIGTPPASIEWNGHVVEVLAVEGGRAQIRLRPR